MCIVVELLIVLKKMPYLKAVDTANTPYFSGGGKTNESGYYHKASIRSQI